jgi:hypothetical protein
MAIPQAIGSREVSDGASLLEALDAFYLVHRLCGELDRCPTVSKKGSTTGTQIR